MSREGTWRRLAREGKIVVPGDGLDAVPMFARVEIAPEKAPISCGGFVAIDFGVAVIRLPGDSLLFLAAAGWGQPVPIPDLLHRLHSARISVHI